jgi:hypothetical protein
MYYDRTVSKALADALSSSGPFSFLVHYAKTEDLADLQLRRHAKPHSKRCWATLYCGLTGVLHVFEQNGQFWLRGRSSNPAWEKSWTEARKAEEWQSAEARLKEYIDLEIGGVEPRSTNEGGIVARLCKPAAGPFGIVDREVIIAFPSAKERDITRTQLLKRLTAAFRRDHERKWFVPNDFRGELDLLAVDPKGRLLAIEVKPASATAGIAWAPLQAAFYADFLKAWSKDVGPKSQQILRDMLQRRIDLGLTRGPNRLLEHRFEIVPVVAFGAPPNSDEAKPRLEEVRKTLLDAKLGFKSLKVWQVKDSGIREIH